MQISGAGAALAESTSVGTQHGAAQACVSVNKASVATAGSRDINRTCVQRGEDTIVTDSGCFGTLNHKIVGGDRLYAPFPSRITVFHCIWENRLGPKCILTKPVAS